MYEPEHPLISCICVTNNRTRQLKRCIEYFSGQSYSNKELIIVYPSDDESTRVFSKKNVKPSIRYFEVENARKISLGQIRNIAVKHSSGEYFCQWDDDDWFHEHRLLLQYKLMKENHKSASVLMNWFLYDKIRQQTYLSETTAWAGSILCSRKLWEEVARYPHYNKSEDQEFISQLFSGNYLYPMVMPYLYVYLYHGKNTCAKGHFENMFSLSQKLPDTINKIMDSIIKKRVSYQEASKLIASKNVLGEINYFHHLRRK